MFEHHRAGPDLADRIGDALAGNIRRRAVHRLEHRREFALRIDVARRRNADGPGAGRAEIGENIAEQVGSDDHIKAIRLKHEQRGENIDVILVPFNVGEILRHGFDALVPERHGDGDAVRLGGGGEMLLRRLACELEGEFQHAIDADARHHRFLHHDFTLGAGEHAAANRRILAFGVLAHDPEVDIAGFAIGERRGHAGHQPHRAKIGVLIEFAAKLNERTPQRNVIGHLGRPADCPEEDRVMAADLLLPVLRHHASVLFVVIA